MEKLELKHLIHYFLYKLIMCEEVQRYNDNDDKVMNYDRGELLSYLGTAEPYIVWRCVYQHSGQEWIRETSINKLGKTIKPILRPLSDLLNDELDFCIDICDETDIHPMSVNHFVTALINKTSYNLTCENWILVSDYLDKNHFD